MQKSDQKATLPIKIRFIKIPEFTRPFNPSPDGKGHLKLYSPALPSFLTHSTVSFCTVVAVHLDSYLACPRRGEVCYTIIKNYNCNLKRVLNIIIITNFDTAQSKSLFSWDDLSLSWTSLTLNFISLCGPYGTYLVLCHFHICLTCRIITISQGLSTGQQYPGLSWCLFVKKLMNLHFHWKLDRVPI